MVGNRTQGDPTSVSHGTSPPQYGLALHTTTRQLGLSIGSSSGDKSARNLDLERRSQTWDLGRDMSAHLQTTLQTFLPPQTWSNLAWIAVAKGPGGFTGTRIGIVTARTLGQQLNCPVFGISTLAAIAWSNRLDIPMGEVIAVQMPAQRGQLFGAVYRINSDPNEKTQFTLQVIKADRTHTLEEWHATVSQVGSPVHQIIAVENLGESVDSILELGHQQWRQGYRPHWSAALPFYGQHPVKK